MVDRWAGATGEARAIAFEAALAVREIETGLASFFSLTFGLAVTLFAIAMFFSDRIARWLAALGLLGGGILLAEDLVNFSRGGPVSHDTFFGTSEHFLSLAVQFVAVLLVTLILASVTAYVARRVAKVPTKSA